MATGFFTGVQAPRRVGQRTRRGAFVFYRESPNAALLIR